jgi:hypothetical protein
MRAKCFHPFFKRFAFRRYVTQIAFESFHSVCLIGSREENIPQVMTSMRGGEMRFTCRLCAIVACGRSRHYKLKCYSP